MNSQLIITLSILVIALVLFLSERLPIDLVALLVLVALGLTRVLTPQEVFSGLSDPAVVTILAIFVLAHGLETTGIAERVGMFLVRTAGGSEIRLIVTLMSVAAFMSLFMNNIAVATILLPVTSTIAKRSGVKLPRLLMPLAFATLLGGMATLFTTTNIVMNSVLSDSGYPPFGVLDFAPVGLPLVVAGTIYMILWGRRMLPAGPPAARSELMHRVEHDLVRTYQLSERLFQARIPVGSCLIDQPLSHSTLREKYGLNVVAVERKDTMILVPTPDFSLQQNDIMLVEGRLEEFLQRDVEPYLEILPVKAYNENDLESASVVVVEVVLAPRSQLIGRTLKESQFRDKYGMAVLAVWNGERVIRTGLQDLNLAFGDALLLQGPRNRLPMLRLDTDLIMLSTDQDQVKARDVSRKAWLAAAIFGLTILIAAVGPFPVGVVMLAGALGMVIANVVMMEQAYRVIEWKVIFLVGGMLPLGLAMTKTGATTLFASTMTYYLRPLGPLVLLFALLTFTVLLSQAMKGAAVSAVIVPIAIQSAQQFGIDPRPLAMGVALATSMAFVTPLGHPVNILMIGPGGYRFKDFFKVGLPLTLLLFAIVMLLLPIIWPFTPQ